MKYLSCVEGKGGIYAKCVAASIANDIPIYTLETRSSKFIDAEFCKHRMLSSNSSSSRAIPTKRILDMVKNDPYIPFSWRKNERGMQGYEEFSDDDIFLLNDNWLDAKYEAILYAEILAEKGVHKQTVNRLLEPFLFQNKVVTGTEWDNFFRLRLASDAQPEIYELATCMKLAIDQATPTELEPGEWHLPYWNGEYELENTQENIEINPKIPIKCSAARCARTSYMTHDKKDPSKEKDVDLYDFLLKSIHLTPFEHQATPMKRTRFNSEWENGVTHVSKDKRFWSGNFHEWIQYRQLINEWNG